MEFPLQLNREKITSLLGIVAATTLVYSVFSLTLWNKKTKGTKKIPVPDSCYPYVGHLLSLGELPHERISAWHKKYGPIINLKMGVQNWVCIGDRYLAHELYIKNGTVFLGPPNSLFARLYSHDGRGVLFSNQKYWKDGRERCRSLLAPKIVDGFTKVIEREVVDLCNRLIEGSEREGYVEPLPHLQLATLNMILNVTMGKRFDSSDDPEVSEMIKMLKHNIEYEGIEVDFPNYLPILSLFDMFSNKASEMKDHFTNSRDRIFRKLIAEAAETKEFCFANALDNGGSSLEEVHKLVILCDILEAGQETIEALLAWSFAILCNRLDLQIKMQKEIDEFTKTNRRPPTFADRESLPFCVSVVKECMRYRSPTPFGGSHVITKDVEISGYLIPEGSTVITSMDRLNFCPETYEDPGTFSPERFMHDTRTMSACANGKLEGRDQFGFGWGRHLCPGVYLAEMESFSTLIYLLSKCTLEPIIDANGNKVYPDFESSVNSGAIVNPTPYKVKFTRRDYHDTSSNAKFTICRRDVTNLIQCEL